MTGQILGIPGHGVAHGSWVANDGVRAAGVKGEFKTALVLNELARTQGVAVLHDLAIPLTGVRANLDHVLVSGRKVLIIDSKLWAPGFYWSFLGAARRGMTVMPSMPRAGRTLDMGVRALTGFLGPSASLQAPVIAVWPSRAGNVSMWALRVPGARVVHGASLAKHLPTLKPADPTIVARLSTLLSVKHASR